MLFRSWKPVGLQIFRRLAVKVVEYREVSSKLDTETSIAIGPFCVNGARVVGIRNTGRIGVICGHFFGALESALYSMNTAWFSVCADGVMYSGKEKRKRKYKDI